MAEPTPDAVERAAKAMCAHGASVAEKVKAEAVLAEAREKIGKLWEGLSDMRVAFGRWEAQTGQQERALSRAASLLSTGEGA